MIGIDYLKSKDRLKLLSKQKVSKEQEAAMSRFVRRMFVMGHIKLVLSK